MRKEVYYIVNLKEENVMQMWEKIPMECIKNNGCEYARFIHAFVWTHSIYLLVPARFERAKINSGAAINEPSSFPRK